MIRPFSPPRSGELTPAGEPTVTQEDLVKTLIDGAILLDRSGGSLYVTVQRAPSGRPHQMVTTDAVVVWQPFTRSKPVPEEATDPTGTEPIDDVALDEMVAAAGEPGEVFDDGLRVDPDAVDESEVPPALRSS